VTAGDDDLPELPVGYFPSDRKLKCSSCPTVLGHIWEYWRADGTKDIHMAELETDRVAEFVDGIWKLSGHPSSSKRRFQLPARVECRRRHLTAIRMDGRSRRWKTYRDTP
jgi:hypothetical protein